jgi:hypothetical protein
MVRKYTIRREWKKRRTSESFVGLDAQRIAFANAGFISPT